MNDCDSEWSGEIKPAASTKFEFALVMEMPVLLTTAGRRPCAVATRFCTSTAAMSRLYPVSNVTVMADVPSFELVDDIYLMPSTPLIACSRIVVTADSTVAEFAPTKLHETTTCGGASCGYSETGSVGIDTAPASTISSAQTVAKMGRRMKNSTKVLTFRAVQRGNREQPAAATRTSPSV